MNAVAPASFVDYKVADITLADFGRREITLAEAPEFADKIMANKIQGRTLVQIA